MFSRSRRKLSYAIGSSPRLGSTRRSTMKPTIAPERWQLIEELFHSSLERDAKDRVVFLINACCDDLELRREVEALVLSYEAADQFIDVPPLAGAISSIVAETAEETDLKSASCIAPGRRIAHYEIRSFL